MLVRIARHGVPRTPISNDALRTRAERMLRELRLPRAELSILLCDDREIQRLNRTHRRKNKPTDVLAFAMNEGDTLLGSSDLLGDVVISLDTARRQAAARQHSLWAEVSTLLAHGLLHLLGFDHRDDAEEAEMNLKTDLLVKASRRAATNSRLRRVDKRARRIENSPQSRTRRT